MRRFAATFVDGTRTINIEENSPCPAGGRMERTVVARIEPQDADQFIAELLKARERQKEQERYWLEQKAKNLEKEISAAQDKVTDLRQQLAALGPKEETTRGSTARDPEGN